jgi:hypothetical protein
VAGGSSAPLDVLDPYSFSNNQYLYLGSTWWEEYGTAPQINSITSSDPNGLILGGSGTLTITGQYLTAGGNDSSPTVGAVSGTGLRLGGAQIERDSQLDVSYNIDSNPSSTGFHRITVTTVSGTSNSYSVQVGDPPPVITGYTPASPWLAGNAYSLSITGSGFGTNPGLSITGVAGLSYSVIGSSDTNISATVTIDASSPGGTASITVTSNGYSGSGNNFVASGSGDSPMQLPTLPKWRLAEFSGDVAHYYAHRRPRQRQLVLSDLQAQHTPGESGGQSDIIVCQ